MGTIHTPFAMIHRMLTSLAQFSILQTGCMCHSNIICQLQSTRHPLIYCSQFSAVTVMIVTFVKIFQSVSQSIIIVIKLLFFLGRDSFVLQLIHISLLCCLLCLFLGILSEQSLQQMLHALTTFVSSNPLGGICTSGNVNCLNRYLPDPYVCKYI